MGVSPHPGMIDLTSPGLPCDRLCTRPPTICERGTPTYVEYGTDYEYFGKNLNKNILQEEQEAIIAKSCFPVLPISNSNHLLQSPSSDFSTKVQFKDGQK